MNHRSVNYYFLCQASLTHDSVCHSLTHLRGPTGTMALPPWAAAEEGLGWPRGDCSLRWAMRPAMEVGVVGAGVAGVPPVPAVTWFGFVFVFGCGFGLRFGFGLRVRVRGRVGRPTASRDQGGRATLTLTLS